MFCTSCGTDIKEGTDFCTQCGRAVMRGVSTSSKRDVYKKYFSKRNILVVLGILVTTTVVGVFYELRHASPDTKDQDIASSVVNIYCEGASGWNGDDVSGGSGTILTTSGLILTNAHIIPSGKAESLNEKSCLVILPDPETGSPKEIYYAKPLVFPEISKKYDLAFVLIDDVYYDQAEDKAYGEYPKEFPAYDSDQYCKNENVKLGEPVRIYGYPAISGGGFALTITDGVVSSLLPKDGYIMTSAKISHGNSGGLAVDKNGCRIGIPSMVTGDENESLGVIISNNLISDFTDEVRAFLN